MADRGSGEAVDSALSYSVLENDADIYTGPSDEYGPRINYARGAGSGKSGRLYLGLRAAAPHVILVTTYIAFLLVGGAFFFLLEGKAGGAEDVATDVEYMEYQLVKERMDKMMDHLNLTQAEMETMGNWSLLWKALDFMVEGPYGLDFDFGPDHHRKSVRDELSFGRSVMFCATTIATIATDHWNTQFDRPHINNTPNRHVGYVFTWTTFHTVFVQSWPAAEKRTVISVLSGYVRVSCRMINI